MNNQAKPVDGARSVYRALQLLDLVAHHHEDGIGLAELVTLTGLDRTTVYRLASTLERENLLNAIRIPAAITWAWNPCRSG